MTRLASPPAPGSGRQGPEYYWAQAKRYGAAGFTIGELHARCRGVTYTTVRRYIHGLRDAGAVQRIGTRRSRGNGAHQAVVYVVAKPALPAPTQHGHLRETRYGAVQRQIWTAVRGLDQFMVVELAGLLDDARPVSLNTVQVYLGRLRRAGLVVPVRRMARKPTGRGGFAPGVYRLLPSANTGPEAPRVIGNRVFDPNTRRFVGEPLDGSEVSA